MYFNFVYLENTDLNCSYINSWTGNLFCGFVLFAIPQFFVSASVSIVALTEEGFWIIFQTVLKFMASNTFNIMKHKALTKEARL